jgi:hypothetical protein
MEKTISQKSKAVSVALAHIEAWSNHKWDNALKGLAPNVSVFVTTTQPIMADTSSVGAEKYMEGLKAFAPAIEPGSAKIIASVGDDRNAMVMVTVTANFGHGKVSLTGSRLYMLDENGKILSEKVIFFVISE